MGPLRLAVLGVVAYGVFLLATLPAALVAPRIGEATRGQVTLAGATGTVWNGAARATIATRGAIVAIDELRWRFLPARLAAGRLAARIEAGMGAARAQGEVSRGPLAWRVEGLRASGDASAFVPFVPLAAAWQPAGAIVVDAPDLAWDGERLAGAATAEWRDASLSLSAARPLGTWRVEATGEGQAIRVSLSTTKGPLRLSGNGTLATTGRLAFLGEARAETGREAELEALLALLGPRRADGARALELR